MALQSDDSGKEMQQFFLLCSEVELTICLVNLLVPGERIDKCILEL